MRQISTSNGCRSFKSVDRGFRPNSSETSLPEPANFPFGDDQLTSAMSFVLTLRIPESCKVSLLADISQPWEDGLACSGCRAPEVLNPLELRAAGRRRWELTSAVRLRHWAAGPGRVSSPIHERAAAARA